VDQNPAKAFKEKEGRGRKNAKRYSTPTFVPTVRLEG